MSHPPFLDRTTYLKLATKMSERKESPQDWTDGLPTEDGDMPSKAITYADMKRTLSTVRQEKGEALDDVLPEVKRLVGIMDANACLPVMQYLMNAIERLDSSKETQVCYFLYPDEKTANALQYLPECKAIGISEVDIVTSKGLSGLPLSMLTKGLVVEIYNYLNKYSANHSEQKVHQVFFSILKSLFQLSNLTDAQQHALYIRASRDSLVLKKLKKNKKHGEARDVCEASFELEGCQLAKATSHDMHKDTGSDELVDRLKSLDLEVSVVSIPGDLRGVVDTLTRSFSLLQKQNHALKSQNDYLSEKVNKVKREKQDLLRKHRGELVDKQVKIDEKTAQLKIARRSRDHFKEQASKVKSEIKSMVSVEKDLAEAKRRNDEMVESILQLERDKKCLKEQVRYYKFHVSPPTCNNEDLSELYYRKVIDLTEEVHYWQNQYEDCKAQIDEFVNQKDISTFEDGRYIDTVREVYMELMCMRVGAKNVQKIIRTVLGKMAGITAQRLPGKTFAKYMLLEARSVAISHLKHEIDCSADDLTVGPDGTTKFGHHYGAITVSLTGKSMVMGLRDMACGNAEAYQNLLEGIIGEMAHDNSNEIRQVAAKIKNTVSDQASVNKKFVTLLTEWREKALPHVVNNWENFTDADKERYVNVNFFFCGLHFLVGLSEQANKTLSVWENLVHAGEKVGSLKLPGGYSKAGESGTTRLVRTVCKAIQDRGCEKSGKPVEFRDYLQHDGNVKDVPLASFKGNRFNILFHNAAGCFYLFDDLQSFAEEHKGDNRLFAAIHADLGVSGFQAGMRALGIISKMVTIPMWRFLEKDGHVSELTPVYQQLYETFKKWGNDASKLMAGKEFLFSREEVHQDEIYNRLITPCPELDPLTCQILELLFCSFQLVCERQLKDHLPGGRYNNWSADLLSSSATVPRTNVGPERIFAELDNLIRIMPRATTNAIEGITMWSLNHTSVWLDKLDPNEREQVLKNARKSAKEQRQLYVERMASIRQQRQDAIVSKRERVTAKEQRDVKRKEELTHKVQQYGGLWKSSQEVDRNLKSLSNQEKVNALQAQITFRRYVLGTPNVGKVLNIMELGKYHNAEKLTANLKSVLKDKSTPSGTSIDTDLESETHILPSISLQEEKAKFLKLVDDEQSKRSTAPKRQRTSKSTSRSDLPEIKDPEELLGKRVQHLFKDKKGKKNGTMGLL